MRGFISVLSGVVFSGCAVVGSKVTMIPDSSSPWSQHYHSNGDSYYYSCNEVSIFVEEILFSADLDAFGPILPIIPANASGSNERESLTLVIKIIGWFNSRIQSADDHNIHVFANRELDLINQSILVIGEKQVEEERFWNQYHIHAEYDIETGELGDNISIQLGVPGLGCEVPKLSLVKTEVSDNEFIVSPGP